MTQLISPLRPFAGFLASVAGFSFFVNILLLVPALFMLQVFDRVLTSRSTETLTVLGIGVAVALLLLMAIEIARAKLLSLLGLAFEMRYSSLVLEAQLHSASAFGRSENAHGIQDLVSLKALFNGVGLLALFDSPWAVIYLIVIYLFHPLLGFAAMLGGIILFALAYLNERLIRETVAEGQTAAQRVARLFDSGKRNAEVLAAMGMVKEFSERWERANAVVQRSHRKSTNIAAYVGSLGKFVRHALQSTMLGLAAFLVIKQEVSAGVMIAATILFGRALQPVELLILSWRGLLEARNSYRRLTDSLRSHEIATTTELPKPVGQVSAEGVWFAPAGHSAPILNGVSFYLEAGEVLCIMGPSASGKSTLARVLIGVWKPTAGAVRLDGADVSVWPRSHLGRHIGYLPQNVELFQSTVAQNIARLGRISSEEVVLAAKRAGAHDMILRLSRGYETMLGEDGLNVSGGQRQRIALARALYGNPCFLVLDEPDSNLDAEGEAMLSQAMAQNRENGITQIIISHRPSVVSMVDKVLLMGGGAVKYFGPRAEIAAQVRHLHELRTSSSKP